MQYNFPEPTGININMMPYIQGDPDSLPEGLESYLDFVANFSLDAGRKGFLTIQESYVEAGTSQRGYGDSERTLHTEACAGMKWDSQPRWGQSVKLAWNNWAGDDSVLLGRELQVLIANSIGGTCAVWDAQEEPTPDGDLGHLAHKYPRERAHIMGAGEVRQIGVMTPHECIKQAKSGVRQFVRIVGEQVYGAADYFTVNPKVKHNI